MKNIAFVKMVASGNDFVVVDNRRAVIPGTRLCAFAREICDRNYGAGGDGLIAIEPSKKADFRMRIINSDGSEAEMCGNGARCAALFAIGNKIAGKRMDFETLAGIIKAEVSGAIVRLKMSDPSGLKPDINLVLSDGRYNVNFVNTGVPHAVIFVEHLEGQDVKTTGKEVRYHSAFAPRGTNADFVEVAEKNLIKVRTDERGVEDETLACGTGVTASAIISAVVKDFKSPVACLTKGGDRLKIYFNRRGNDFTDVYLEGGAREVFLGRYLYK